MSVIQFACQSVTHSVSITTYIFNLHYWGEPHTNRTAVQNPPSVTCIYIRIYIVPCVNFWPRCAPRIKWRQSTNVGPAEQRSKVTHGWSTGNKPSDFSLYFSSSFASPEAAKAQLT